MRASATPQATFIRSLTWIFSSERTAFLIFWRDFSVALPAASLSKLASISLQVKGRVRAAWVLMLTTSTPAKFSLDVSHVRQHVDRRGADCGHF